MSKTNEGSSAHLIRLCAGYLVVYVLFGFFVKVFLKEMSSVQYLVYSTASSNVLCIGIVVALRWYKVRSNKPITWGPLTFPSEYLYIIPSGLCTAVVIPTTTLMYTLPISVMVAMVIMRGSVIVISRIVDAVQIRQGILQKKVYWEENVAVALALAAVSVNVFGGAEEGGFEFLHNAAALSILGSYILAYLIRIYIMNFYKNTRPKGAPSDNTGFFAVEQIASTTFLLIATALIFVFPAQGVLSEFRAAITDPHPMFRSAALSGLPFGAVAFFSVFIFMFKGRTATFAGLVNRLTSLIAGTISTLLFALTFAAKWPTPSDWGSLAIILIAVAFLTRAEKRRALELAQEK